MLIIKNKIIKWKILIFLISILTTSCTVNDKEAFDEMLYEAKKLFSNITKENQEINSENNELRETDVKRDLQTISDRRNQKHGHCSCSLAACARSRRESLTSASVD